MSTNNRIADALVKHTAETGTTAPRVMYLGRANGLGEIPTNDPIYPRSVWAHELNKQAEQVLLPDWSTIPLVNDIAMENVVIMAAKPPGLDKLVLSMSTHLAGQQTLGANGVTPFESQHNDLVNAILSTYPANYVVASPDAIISAYGGSASGRRLVLNDFPTVAAVGQPLLAGSTAPAYGALNLAGGATIVTGITPVTNGGSGAATLTAHALVVGNGVSAVNALAPSTARNVAISDGADWTSRALIAADTPLVLPLVGGTLTGPVVFTPQATPSTAEGKVYYDSTAHALEYYNGSAWVSLTSDTGITQLTGDVTAGPGSGSQSATLATVNSNVGVFAIATVTANAKGLITAVSAASTTGSGNVVLATSPTIVTPTIADFTNATHNHQNNAGGGTLTTAAIASGTFANSFINWAAPGTLGSTTPNTVAATTISGTTITATTAFVGPIIAPSADSTTAILIKNAAQSQNVGIFDTTNWRYGLNVTPSQTFDLGYGNFRFTQLTAPGAPTVALAGLGAGNLTNGAYTYQITLVNAAGETQNGTTSATVTVVDATTNGQIALSSIPTGVSGITTSRKIYRTVSGGSTYKLVATISDNTTTTYTDNIADASLGAAVSTENTTAGKFFIGSTNFMQADQLGNVAIAGGVVLPDPEIRLRLYRNQTTVAPSGAQSFTLRLDSDVNLASNSTATYNGFYTQVNADPTKNTGTLNGYRALINHAGTGSSVLQATVASIQITNTSVSSATVLSTATRGYSVGLNFSASGTLNNWFGTDITLGNTGTGTILNAEGHLVETPTGTGAITTNIAFHARNQGRTGITTSYGLKLDDQTGSTTNWAINTGKGLNQLGDQVLVSGSADRVDTIIRTFSTKTTDVLQLQDGVNSNTVRAKWDSTFSLTTAAFDAGTNAVLNALVIGHNTSVGASVVANYGTGVLLQAQDNNTANTNIARWRAFWNTAVHTSQAATVVLSAYGTAEQDAITIKTTSSGTIPLIGLGTVSNPTAYLHLPAGTTAASGAPLKFNSGTSMTSAEAGAVEFTTDDLFFTITTGTARKRALFADPVGGLTTGRVPYNTTNGRLTDTAGFAFDGTTLTTSKLALTAGSGSGAPKVGGSLFAHHTDVGNTTILGLDDDLYSDTIPASTLATNDDLLEAQYGGTFVSSATATREVKVWFGGTAIFDTGALTLSLSAAWTAYVTIIRVSATIVRYMISFTTEGAALAAYTAVGELTGLTLSNTNVLKITGAAAGVGAAANDIVAKLATVAWYPAP